jgi:hypothetical protein
VEEQRGRLVAGDAQVVHDAEARARIGRRLVMSNVDGYDIDPSGRFLVLESSADATPAPLDRPVVVLRPAPR